MQEQPKLISAVLAITFLISIVTVALVALYKLTQDSIVIGIVGGVTSVIVAAYQFRKAKEHEADARLFPEKAKAYGNLIEILRVIFAAQREKKPVNMVDVAEKLQNIRSQLIIWGSARTIKALDNLGGDGAESDPKKLMHRLAVLYHELRIDLGHKSSVAEALEIALGHVVAAERNQLR